MTSGREAEVDHPLEIERSVEGLILKASSGSGLVAMTLGAAKEAAVRMLQAVAEAERCDDGSA